MVAKTIEFDENGKSPVLQPWSEEEILDYQEIGKKKLGSFFVYTIKNVFSERNCLREKIQNYQNMIGKELEPFYYTKGIPRSDPEARMKYITSILEMLGYNFKRDNTNYLAMEEGKAKALVFLENIFLIEKNNLEEIEIEKAKTKMLNLVEKIFLMEKETSQTSH